MKNCTHCKYAEWRKTSSGRLHPSGDGRCKYEWKMPPIPGCKYWIGKSPPMPLGGHIYRKAELKDHCPYFAYEDTKNGVR